MKESLYRIFTVFALTVALLVSTVTPNLASAATKALVPELAPANASSQIDSARVANETAPINADVYKNTGKTKTANSTLQIAATAASPVATLTIFADPSGSTNGSSGGDGSTNFGTHAFITVRNVSGGNINIGKFSGIAPNRTMSLGTWGNKSEHRGLWYNLESKFVYANGAYAGRVSVSYIMTATQLNTLNSFIINNDYWSLASNCSNFAVRAWNSVVDSSYQLSAGVPNTPKNLANNLKSRFPGYSSRHSVPYDYVVYFANGTGAPSRSTQF